ncbi:metallophosphoesterase family protein [Gorillibacterium timonense]|uniref:metallophosphoesterase family protein n=1 Tax=Gorillibacterium timonense TaxID=1689269 RepID=UPI0009E8A4CC|nr:metallophosphoesterase family protein [Gorillibacterium timonense]
MPIYRRKRGKHLGQVTFAVFTDLHYDRISGGDRRLDEFLNTVRRTDPDFIIELGDLCHPMEENRFLLERLEQAGVPCYHVIGNHDSDRSCRYRRNEGKLSASDAGRRGHRE